MGQREAGNGSGFDDAGQGMNTRIALTIAGVLLMGIAFWMVDRDLPSPATITPATSTARDPAVAREDTDATPAVPESRTPAPGPQETVSDLATTRPNGFQQLEADVAALELDDQERRAVLGSVYGLCSHDSPPLRRQPQTREQEALLRLSDAVVDEFRRRHCAGIPDDYGKSINALGADERRKDPMREEVRLLGGVLRETPDEPLAIEKLEAIATARGFDDVALNAAFALMQSAPRKWALGRMAGHLTGDDQRLRELQSAAMQLARCRHLKQCGAGQIQYIVACRDVHRCRSGESLGAFYRRIYSQEEAAMVEAMSAVLIDGKG